MPMLGHLSFLVAPAGMGFMTIYRPPLIVFCKAKRGEYNKRFMQMCSHYLTEPVACAPASGWEKGQIEKQVQDVRNWLFVPRPRFADLAELNTWLSDRCQTLSETSIRQKKIAPSKRCSWKRRHFWSKSVLVLRDT